MFVALAATDDALMKCTLTATLSFCILALALAVPIEVEALEPAWSPDGRQLLVALWTPPSDRRRPGVVEADGRAQAWTLRGSIAAQVGHELFAPCRRP